MPKTCGTFKALAVIFALGFTACGPVMKQPLDGLTEEPSTLLAPSNFEINGFPCPSARCVNNAFETMGGASVTIKANVAAKTFRVSSSDSTGTFDNQDFFDGHFIFTTSVTNGETRAVTFTAYDDKNKASDSVTITISSSQVNLTRSPTHQGTANDKTSNGVTLRSFGFATVGANDTATSGSTTLELGFSNVMGRTAQ